MSDSLKIVLILDHFEPGQGGLESWTDGLANWLVRRGHEVQVLCFGGVSKNPAIGLRILDGAGGPLERAATVARALSGLPVDIVHDTGTADCADVFHPQTGSRLINAEYDVAARSAWLRLYSRLSPNFRRWRREMEELERRQFADPSRLIAVSRMVRDQIATRYGLDGARIPVLYNGVDADRFAPDRLLSMRAAARSRWSLDGAIAFLLVGHNFHLKGVGMALRALARLKAEAPGIRLVVAGAGDVPGYSRLARSLDVASHVRFLGRLERIEEAYAAADVALHPTHYDACSLVTLEGLASGLPTITTRTNGAGELIVSDKQGILLESSSDADALARAMKRMLDPDLRRSMGQAARTLALAHGIEENYRAIESFYRQSLARRPAGAERIRY